MFIDQKIQYFKNLILPKLIYTCRFNAIITKIPVGFSMKIDKYNSYRNARVLA